MTVPDTPEQAGDRKEHSTNAAEDITSIFSDFDLYLFGQGKHYHLYEKMGAHLRTVNGVSGVNFAVWAPNARMVSVIGDFNNWNRLANPLHLRHQDLGVWECFIPGMSAGNLYKFAVFSRFANYTADKIDPYGFAAELRPNTANIVADIHQHKWQDEHWMQDREHHQQFSSPISIYEVHPGSWRHVPERHQEGAVEEDRFMTYRELAHSLAPYVKEMGFTHIELMPITEYPFDGSWGYQVTGYYAPTSRFGSPEDFQYFIDYMHQQEIGVLLDWVPSHFPKDGHALSYYDGTHLYEYSDPRKGEHKQWGTYVFDYGRSEVRNFLVANALFWLREYHIDGLRVDAVASMLYLDYMRENLMSASLINTADASIWRRSISSANSMKQSIVKCQEPLRLRKNQVPGPAVSRPTYVGGLGFTFKWNMGWMHDMLEYMRLDPIHRRYHHNNITFSLMYAYSENFVLPLSHDEVVHIKGSLINKMPGDLWQRFANLRAFFGYMWGHPGKKLLFMGGEFGQWSEWNYKESLDWHMLEPPSDPRHKQLQTFVQDLNRIYRQEPALSVLDCDAEGFSWIDCYDSDNSVVSFQRRSKRSEDTLVCICNFTPVTRPGYRLGVPDAGEYYEVINSDDVRYGGSGQVNTNAMPSGPLYWQSCPHSIMLTLPPLSTVILKRRPISHREEEPS